MRKRTFLLLMVAILLAALLGLAIADNAGYVLIAYKGFRYESTFWIFLALGGGLLATLYALRRLLGLMSASGRLVNPWSGRNRQRRALQAAERGFLELAAGRWSHALRLLQRAAAQGQQSLVAYLGAARAAHELGEHEQSDALLREALEREPKAAVAVGLLQAELQIERGQDEQALAALLRIREQHPRHPRVLRLLPDVYERLQDWQGLCQLLPDLQRQQTLKPAALTELELRARCALLEQAAQRGAGDLAVLREAWQQLPQALRQQPGLLARYAGLLRGGGAQAEAEAEELLRGALNRAFEPQLVSLYGLLQGRDLTRQLAAAEGWLKQHGSDAALLLALGRLSLRNRLWGKARDYFERSLAAGRSPEACLELARLLERLGEHARSQQVLQQGVNLLGRDLPALPQPGAARA